jgi:ATP/maltotriose-dependent transcriptional regulator MalT
MGFYYVSSMTMSFLLHDSPSELDPAELTASSRVNRGRSSTSAAPRITIIEEKFRLPEAGSVLSRERLLDLLDKSIAQYGATLVSGRAGTGKTTLAAEFALCKKKTSWFTIEPADADWREFSAGFLACLFDKQRPNSATFGWEPSEAAMSNLLSYTFARLARQRVKPRLIVLDNVHHLFDAEWFSGFFKQLVISLDESARLLMLCRSKPSAPLWRMRSKQMLNVIDETMLELTDQEAIEIGQTKGASKEISLAALKRSYGRVGNFAKIL